MCANNTKKHCKFFTFKFKKINIYFLCFYNQHFNFQNQNMYKKLFGKQQNSKTKKN